MPWLYFVSSSTVIFPSTLPSDKKETQHLIILSLKSYQVESFKYIQGLFILLKILEKVCDYI